MNSWTSGGVDIRAQIEELKRKSLNRPKYMYFTPSKGVLEELYQYISDNSLKTFYKVTDEPLNISVNTSEIDDIEGLYDLITLYYNYSMPYVLSGVEYK